MEPCVPTSLTSGIDPSLLLHFLMTESNLYNVDKRSKLYERIQDLCFDLCDQDFLFLPVYNQLHCHFHNPHSRSRILLCPELESTWGREAYCKCTIITLYIIITSTSFNTSLTGSDESPGLADPSWCQSGRRTVAVVCWTAALFAFVT